MNHTLAGAHERWQREIEQRAAEHMRRDREATESEQRHLDQVRRSQAAQAAAIAQAEGFSATRGMVIWGIVSAALAVALAAALGIHF